MGDVSPVIDQRLIRDLMVASPTDGQLWSSSLDIR